ncbi:hypothetical protein [Pseudoalteromonas sp. 2CM36K]|uniref:hypothetical protein n=1 Tax=Pseudoalteromonas sp. 2CM36K TaxID=2929854 RepID=UPI0020BFE3E5|nr:hypothetical protein [Pseudoalteromonas sp. 2CM36K]MCK8103652.1 hypothetical protein [Pseudoalteromonas sp. 2CM36K]
MSDSDKFNKSKKAAFKHLKAIGLFDKFKESLQNAPPKSTVIFYDDGHVCILGETGQRFLKKPQIFFDSYCPNGEFISKPIAFSERAMKKAIKIRQSLEEEGYFLQPKANRKLSLIDAGNEFVLSHFGKRTTTETMLELKLSYLENIIIALSNSSTEDEKLNATYELGALEQKMSIYGEYGSSQRKVASQERKKGLSEIFEKLRERKTAGEKPKELWYEFVSMLHEKKETYDQVQESTTNLANSKTWKVSFLILANRDDKSPKEEHMTYERFRRRLNEK